MYTGFVQRGLPHSSPKNAAAPLYHLLLNLPPSGAVATRKDDSPLAKATLVAWLIAWVVVCLADRRALRQHNRHDDA